MLNSANLLSNTIWAILETILIIGGGVRFFYKINQRLDKIEYQFHPNGGESIKDQLNRQDEKLHELCIDVAILKSKMENK
jgi:hypothetical protein